MTEKMTFTDAPASLTIKCEVQGYDTLFTLRAMTGAELVSKLPVVLDALEALGAEPTVRRQNGNGQDSTGNNHGGDPTWCPIHNVQMKRREKDGDVWHSHKAPDGSWCRGKAE